MRPDPRRRRARRPPFTVRAATKDDLNAVVDLLTAVAAEGRWIATELPVDHARRREGMLQQLQRSDARRLVAIGDDRIIGELGIAASPAGLLEFGMMVAEDWRGRGVGSALLAEGIAWGREIGARKITLQVFPHNVAGRALYRRFGFEEDGYFRRHLKRKNGEFWDCIQMSLSLDE
jgi:RimJ/RimL family protein N-acetyltransferase